MLVVLRVAIGWHFLYQGMEKVEKGDQFSSQGFLHQAKGPLADVYHDLIPDYDGRIRLGKAADDGDYGANVLERWQAFLDRFAEHYALDEAQRAEAEQVLAKHRNELEDHLADNAEEIEVYFFDLDKLEQDKQDDRFRHTPYQQKRLWDKQQQLRTDAAVWLAKIDDLTSDYHAELHDLLRDEQRARGELDDDDAILPYLDQLVVASNLAIGVCLIVGLFTRFASFSGGLFLLTIILSQPPWPTIYPAPHPAVGSALIVNKDVIEMLAMFALAATHVGRWGGLDFFVHHLLIRPLFGKKEPS